ncbi:MAG: zinc dependent phospholipase C family protein [Oscillospiraceae bacterium]|nr:zinc dependent phospholipase C family protein [Oscillospiraceae bacterium]
MAEWVSHLIVADRMLEILPWLKRHEFCVGSIAPDCNLPNADGTGWTPSRQVTHWMQGARKTPSDCIRFCESYIIDRCREIDTDEELSFLYGYYAHLITDAELQRYTRDEQRVRAVWERVDRIPELSAMAQGIERDWDGYKMLFPDRMERAKDFFAVEKEYLDSHPQSGYFTEIRGLTSFPDYIGYLPAGAIPQKVRHMYYMPSDDGLRYPFTGFSREEYMTFLDRAVALSVSAVEDAQRIMVSGGWEHEG